VIMSEGMRVNPTWAASLAKQLQETRDALRARDPAEIALRSGTACEVVAGETRVAVTFWGRRYVVSWPELSVRGNGAEDCPEPVQSPILQYLMFADGAPLENTWVSLRNLPHGSFYEQAFQSYSGNLLARTFRRDLEGFRAAAAKLGGESLAMGDAAFRFWALPRIPLAVVFWSGGEEFPDSAQVLFDKSAGHYQHLEMLAHLGAMICERIVQAREKR